MAATRKAPRMNGASFDAREVIAHILDSEALRTSVHFSSEVHRSEPILTTGRQMASYLPDRYREMRELARPQRDANGKIARPVSNIELFYRQARFMEDFEDDCPYQGDVRLYFPTYGTLSDRQLRGYFTWRAHVRRGDYAPAPLTFVYLHIYELLCGVGASCPLEAHHAIAALWHHYREAYPVMDCNLSQWLTDHVAYHNLDLDLLKHDEMLAFDRALSELDASLASLQREARGAVTRRKKGAPAPSALALPARIDLEERLFAALDATSTYQLSKSRFHREDPDGLRHVACSVFVRLDEYYAKHRTLGLTDTLFGQEVSSPHAMFRLALFFDEAPHPDAVACVAPGVTYTCERGLWTVDHRHASHERNSQLGGIMHAIDRSLRDSEGYEHPLKPRKALPKYVQAMIDDEVEAWVAWRATHAPIRIEVDLSKLAGIRSAAAKTREALLVDEEREGWQPQADPAGQEAPVRLAGACPEQSTAVTMPVTVQTRTPVAPDADETADKTRPAVDPDCPAPASAPLVDARAQYLQALLADDDQGREEALRAFGASEDMLVDAVNELLFDTVGDTVIEFGAEGPELIDDYLNEVEEYLRHGR